jgi:hypothetical protein
MPPELTFILRKLIMKSVLLLVFFLNSILLFTQKIVWESEYKLEKPVMMSFCQVIKDKNNNYVSIFRDVETPVSIVNFIKYNPEGKLIRYDSIEKQISISADCFYETDNGYRAFCGANGNLMSLPFLKRLPYIINYNMSGEIINELCPYDLNEFVMIPENTYTLKLEKSNVLNIGNNFYLAFEKSMVKISENSQTSGAHFILSKYDEFGNIKFRYGYDTVKLGSHGPDEYFIRDFDKTYAGNLVLLAENYDNNLNGITNTSIIILELDTNGNKIKKYVYEHDVREILSACIAPLTLGGYIVKCKYLDNADEFYWKIDNDGKIIKKAIIPHHQNSNFTYNTNRMKLTPDGGVLLFGKHRFYTQPNLEFDSSRFYMIKLNSELEIEWEYEWYECIYEDMSIIRDVLFLDNENIIVTGCKDRFKFYIAQIHIGKTDVKEKPENKVKLSVRPQPFRDICEITVENAAGQSLTVNIYDALGKKVMNLCDETAQSDRKSFLLNGRFLAPGTYFVEVKAGKEVIREKLIRVD